MVSLAEDIGRIVRSISVPVPRSNVEEMATKRNIEPTDSPDYVWVDGKPQYLPEACKECEHQYSKNGICPLSTLESTYGFVRRETVEYLGGIKIEHDSIEVDSLDDEQSYIVPTITCSLG